MEIHSTNHTRRPDNSTHRIRLVHDQTATFEIVQAGMESGIKIQAKNSRFTYDVALSPAETRQLITAILRK